MSMSENTPDLGELLSAFCDGQPEPDIVEQLEKELRGSPIARAEYLDYMMVHGILRRDYAVGSVNSAEADDLQSSGTGNSDRRASPVLGFLGDLLPDGLTGLASPGLSTWMLFS